MGTPSRQFLALAFALGGYVQAYAFVPSVQVWQPTTRSVVRIGRRPHECRKHERTRRLLVHTDGRLGPVKAAISSSDCHGEGEIDITGIPWEETLQLPQTPPVVEEPDRISMRDKVYLACSLFSMVLAMTSLLSMASPGSWRYFLAGGVCAAMSHTIPTPIDVVKTRKQVDPALLNVPMLEACRIIVKEEGMVALLAGLGPTVWGYLLEGAMKFGVYEVLKPGVKSLLVHLYQITKLSFIHSQFLTFVACGAVSGVAASLVLCPMEALRIRMVSEPEFAPRGFVQGLLKILRREGVLGLFKGMVPMMLKQVPYTIGKNVSFDFMTKAFYLLIAARSIVVTPAISFAVPFLSALVASVLSAALSQPGDMLLSLVNAHEGNIGTGELFDRIRRSEKGKAAFFVGFKTRILHVGITVTLQLLIYDYVKRLCGIAATGSM